MSSVPSPADEEPASADGGAAPGPKTRVLFVDPEPTACVIAHYVLSRAGLDVDVAFGSLELLRLVQAEEPAYDVLVCAGDRTDVPVEEVARRLRAQRPEIAVALADKQHAPRRAPCDAWLEKPYPPKALVEVVRVARLAREQRRGR